MYTSALLFYCLFVSLFPSLQMAASNFDLSELEKQQARLKIALLEVQQQIELIKDGKASHQSNDVQRIDSDLLPTSTSTSATPTTTTASSSETTTSISTTESNAILQSINTAATAIASTTVATIAATTPMAVAKSRTRHRPRPFSTPFKELLIQNLTAGCQRFDRNHLINELKVHGTYNPDFMAWDVSGVRRFLMSSIVSYDKQKPDDSDRHPMFQRNLDALEKMMAELDLKNCEVRTEAMKERLHNITSDLRDYYDYRIAFQALNRQKRQAYYLEEQISMDRIQMPFGISRNEAIAIAKLLRKYNRAEHVLFSFSHDDPGEKTDSHQEREEELIGTRHVYECDKRGSMHDGYLRMCATCRGIRWMPKEFFPPFINEVLCEEKKSCLYFYDYPHGKCLQKHLNFQILRNIGTDDCQIWQKYDLNVPVCCECFVDHMSFFAKYV